MIGGIFEDNIPREFDWRLSSSSFTLENIPKLESLLETMLNSRTDGKNVKVDCSELKVSEYRILHRDNPQSSGYLDSLIENGNLTVGHNEHWRKSY